MGVPSYLIAETLNLSLAQRLVRKLCNHCKVEVDCDKDDFPMHYTLPYELTKHHKAVGCNHCYHTGYSGRTALYEVVNIDNAIAEKIKHNTITKLFSKDKDYKSLADKAFDLLASGETSLDEIYAVLINM